MATIANELAEINGQPTSPQVHQAQQLVELVRRFRTTVAEQADAEAVAERLAAHAAREQSTSAAVVEQLIAQITDARADWQRHWEQAAVRLAMAIAERVIRGELSRRPEISLAVVREALQLAAGAADITLRVSPGDYELLGGELERLADALCQLAPTDVVADADVSPGGCLVETRFGQIDLTIESQLRQIEQELLDG